MCVSVCLSVCSPLQYIIARPETISRLINWFCVFPCIFFHLVLTFSPHDIIMVNGLLVLNDYWKLMSINRKMYEYVNKAPKMG